MITALTMNTSTPRSEWWELPLAEVFVESDICQQLIREAKEEVK